MFATPLLISWQNSILFVLAVYLYLLVQMDKDWATSPPTSMACIKWSQPSTTSFGWDTIPIRVYSQKKARLETKHRPPSPPTTKPYPLNPLDRGPTPFSRLVVLRALCACSTIFYFCLLSFPYHFGYSRLALFRSAACLCLISSCVSYCVCHFLWFNFSFLHAIFTADISWYSLFLFIVLLHISIHAYPFIQKDLCLCRPDNDNWIKRILGPICLDLSKSFY